ncbi:MAG: imidazole glycerol phosphate synthase cyclase subunit [Labilithrix sp.]|nr:imidazole glycerol phosphate synthase cyclase subunit [Labilithrix sp.]MCW5814735.1 imidazole glycerol phosphate synthase cyclase subunit [Labilithrix sp.]
MPEAPSRPPGSVPRLIARLDIKAPQGLVKGIHLEGFRVVGDPGERAPAYYEGGADELVYMDVVASLYERNSLTELVSATAERIFVPLTVGGGIRSVDDVHRLLRAGADKVAINTAAIRRPELIREAARTFGSQCIVLSVEAKRRAKGTGWEAYTDNGRERTGRDVVEWIQEACDLGAGEVLLTSVDREGTRRGFDLELVAAVGAKLSVPLIACGGAGKVDDIASALERGADAVALASVLHYDMETFASLKAGLRDRGFEVRS